MKLPALLISLIITSACVQGTKKVTVTGGSLTDTAPGIWSGENGSFPKTIHISQDFDAAETTNITNMLNAWETSIENKFNFFEIGTTVSDISNTVSNIKSLHDDVYGIYKMRDWPGEEFGYTALAVTQIFGRGYNQGTTSAYNVIYHADIILNDRFRFRTNDTDSGFDLQTVMLHEMGHFLGLNHMEDYSKRALSVMYGHINDLDQKRTPLSIDIQDIANKYSISPGPNSPWTASRSPMIYRPLNNDPGEEIYIIMQLHANGDCIHKMNGVEIRRHQVKL